MSLLYIGFMVVIITDLSSIFGCLVGLKDEVTAVTIITFGTSQIDLFATKISAISDPTADNSIGKVSEKKYIETLFLALNEKYFSSFSSYFTRKKHTYTKHYTYT